MTAERLLQRLKARDAEAQRHFREHVRGRLIALCVRELRSEAMAEDVVEDVLTDFLFGQVDRMRSPHAVNRYLWVITLRRCRRLLQVERRHAALRAERLVEPVAKPDIVSRLDEPRIQARLAHCMTKLTGRARQMLRMKFHKGMTNAEVGEAFGFSGQYASRVMGKAIEVLRRCMEPVA